MLINILIAELMVLCFILIVSYIILYLSGDLPEKDDARITYKQFRIFDAIAPEKWTERSFNSLYYTDEYNQRINHLNDFVGATYYENSIKFILFDNEKIKYQLEKDAAKYFDKRRRRSQAKQLCCFASLRRARICI